MQIKLVAVGSHGDVLPFIGLGTELVRRGHAVILAAPAPFACLAARADLPFHALGTCADYDRAVASPDLWHPRRGASVLFEHFAAATEWTYDWLARTSRPGETLVVASTLGVGARVAQDKLGLPVVTVHVMPMMVESRDAAPVLPGIPFAHRLPSRLRHWLGRGADRYVIDRAALPRLNALRQRLDLSPVRRLRHWWNSPTRILLMFPDWFAAPQADWPAQATQVGFPLVDRFGDAQALSRDLADFLDAGPAPLVFTYGSAMRQGQAFFRTACALCRVTGRRGVLLAPQDGQVPTDLPAGIVHLPYAPLSTLLPRAAALIHHGGVGTVAQALAAGIPQLVIPVAFDHFDEGLRLQRLGLGAVLRRRRFTPARAARVLDRLLASNTVAEACATARARVSREDGIVTACDAIERLIASR
ncbi:O-mycaminosyltylonolide 6-deoxyallosyltransferase [Methylobacterium adhaesivum]|uniref:Glycosyltransferase n=1 Tax=Methylobacterium adhaesivum TaxID=333297 RepID=A0ABT8BDL9_9HYPH|nr:glycosyltransferase [Methylobacterium adhaesivum]MDN3589481.1 glycosyltransferase [Methylobacterium adhaesivum]GJD30498.1 O-mycaminosyltylonolide 6-deoxyallosyltransferase [Methylobacterium adhaesivum]